VAEPAVAVFRNGRQESVTLADVAVVDSTGHLVAWVGNPYAETYWRSAAKPFQAVAFVLSGAAAAGDVSMHDLAVTAGSHHAEPPHVAAVQRLLARSGCDETALILSPAWPLSRPAREALARAGAAPGPLYDPCSGKHAAMLATAVHTGEPVEGYWRPTHSVQQRIRDVIGHFVGLKSARVLEGTDGCGVPTYFLPLARMALAYARLTDPRAVPDDEGQAALLVAEAMRRHPELTAGTRSLEVDVAAATQGRILVKTAAEGLFGAAVPERGWGIAAKVQDGGYRAVPILAAALLALLVPNLDGEGRLQELGHQTIQAAGGEEVGEMVPVFRLQRGQVS